MLMLYHVTEAEHACTNRVNKRIRYHRNDTTLKIPYGAICGIIKMLMYELYCVDPG